MRYGVVFTVAMLMACAAQADPITIRSGEHDAYTRLVFYTASPRDWSLRRGTGGYVLTLDGEPAQVVTENVFDFIPRSRITDVSARDGRVSIDVGCDCHARAFDYREGILVVDVVDGPPPPGSPFERDDTAFVDFDFDPSHSFPLTATDPEPEVADLSRADTTVPSFFPNLAVDLTRSISEVSGVGLAEVSRPGPSRSAATEGLPELGVEISDARVTLPGRSGADCEPPETFDLANWFLPQEADDLLAAESARFAQNHDADPGAAALRLARAYAALGFGSEAAHVIANAGLTTPEARAVVDIAEVVDDPLHGRDTLIPSQSHCRTPASLWSVLALDVGEAPAGDVDWDLVLRTLSALPPHLRRHLAPKLAEQLQALGDPVRAETARFAAARLPDQAMDGADAPPQPEQDRTANWMLARLQSSAAQGAPVGLADRETAESLIHASKGAPISAPLTAAYVAALSAADDEAAAVSFLRREAASAFFDAMSPAVALSQVVQSITADPDLDKALRLIPEIALSDLAAHLGDTDRAALALRLLDAGLVGLVDAFGVAPASGSDVSRLYRATLALEAGEAAEAIARLEGVTGSRAATLRARALRSLGAFEAAARDFLSVDDAGSAGSALWLAEDLDDAAELLPASPRRTLASLLTRAEPREGPESVPETGPVADGSGAPAPQTEETLSGIAERVGQSAAFREIAQDLLAQP